MFSDVPLGLEEEKLMIGETNWEIFISVWIISEKHIKNIVFSAGCYDDITKKSRMEFPNAAKSDNKKNIK